VSEAVFGPVLACRSRDAIIGDNVARRPLRLANVANDQARVAARRALAVLTITAR
jgi:hypothetical protein